MVPDTLPYHQRKKNTKRQEQIKRLPARTHRNQMKARQEPMAAQADDRQGAAYPEGSRQEGRTGKRAEAARASMARREQRAAVGAVGRRRPMRGEVAAEWLRFVLPLSPLFFYRVLGGLAEWSRRGVVYIAKIYNPTAKAKGEPV